MSDHGYPAHASHPATSDSDPRPGGSFFTRLSDLPEILREALLQAGIQRQWRRGQAVAVQGRRNGSVMVCLNGPLAVVLSHAEEDDTLLRFLEPGEVIGLADAMADLPMPASIVAQGPATTLHLDRRAFLDLLQQQPDAAARIVILLSRRVCELFGFLESNRPGPLSRRVIKALGRLAASSTETDHQQRPSLRITQAQLAQAASASRQRVQLELKKLQAEGRIALGYGRITLLEPITWTATHARPTAASRRRALPRALE